MGRTLAVLAFMLTGCGIPTTSHTTSTPTPAAAIGQAVRDGKFEFIVSNVGGLPQPWYGPAPPARGQ
ncbi:hypothetical protein [Mycobacterium sp.]|jgi:hypothetical protein|uniref:hypothetical protein n=1 Tax=Mycobacterium sp. TaxID=1785 RepID=UPI00333E8AD3